MSYRRRNLDSVVSSGRSSAIGTRIRFLNNDIADMDQDGNFNLRNMTGTIVDWDWNDFNDTLFIQLDNRVDLLDDWDNVLQLDLNYYRNTQVYIYNNV
tara:strand:+ start:35 stop:328 length:294 start_codon:yes stop_codon:yes gene_type:complete